MTKRTPVAALLAAVLLAAAAQAASRRRSMGVVPAWLSCPTARASHHTCACAPVTTPIALPSFSRMGPCSSTSPRSENEEAAMIAASSFLAQYSGSGWLARMCR